MPRFTGVPLIRPVRHLRAIVLAAALLVTALPHAPLLGSTERQTMLFTGDFYISAKPERAGGESIKAVAGTHLRDLTICGRTTTNADGSFAMHISPADARCTDRGYNDGRGPVSYIFVWRGQKVGGASVHFDPRRPIPRTMKVLLHASASPPRAVPRGEPEDISIFGSEPEELIVPRRYFGRVRVASGGPPRDVSSVVLVNGTFPCGTTPVSRDGTFVLDVVPTDECACPNAEGPKHLPKFTFMVGGRAAWSTNFHLHLDRPATLGRTEAITLYAPWVR